MSPRILPLLFWCGFGGSRRNVAGENDDFVSSLATRFEVRLRSKLLAHKNERNSFCAVFGLCILDARQRINQIHHRMYWNLRLSCILLGRMLDAMLP